MRKQFILAGVVAIVLIGCSSSSGGDSEPAPKGMAPETTNAPPGAMNPEQRGMAEQRANSGDQDGGAGK